MPDLPIGSIVPAAFGRPVRTSRIFLECWDVSSVPRLWVLTADGVEHVLDPVDGGSQRVALIEAESALSALGLWTGSQVWQHPTHDGRYYLVDELEVPGA